MCKFEYTGLTIAVKNIINREIFKNAVLYITSTDKVAFLYPLNDNDTGM